MVANRIAKQVLQIARNERISWKYQDFPRPKSNFPCPKSDFPQRLSNFCQRLSAFLNGFLISSTAFQFSSTAFHFPRNPRKSIYGGKYPKDCYSRFVFPATCSPSFVIPATMSTSPPTSLSLATSPLLVVTRHTSLPVGPTSRQTSTASINSCNVSFLSSINQFHEFI